MAENYFFIVVQFWANNNFDIRIYDNTQIMDFNVVAFTNNTMIGWFILNSQIVDAYGIEATLVN